MCMTIIRSGIMISMVQMKNNPNSCLANMYHLLPFSLKSETRYNVFLPRLLLYEKKFYDFSEYLAYVSG
jgi:hypothetical protein